MADRSASPNPFDDLFDDATLKSLQYSFRGEKIKQHIAAMQEYVAMILQPEIAKCEEVLAMGGYPAVLHEPLQFQHSLLVEIRHRYTTMVIPLLQQKLAICEHVCAYCCNQQAQSQEAPECRNTANQLVGKDQASICKPLLPVLIHSLSQWPRDEPLPNLGNLTLPFLEEDASRQLYEATLDEHTCLQTQ